MIANSVHQVPAPDDGEDDGYFRALHDAMQQTPRGRWFLGEHARRARGDEGAKLLAAMERLTASVNETRANAALDIMRRELQEMSASIVQTRREIASIKPAECGNNKIVAATEELDHIVRSTEQATADILTASERLQTIGMELQDAGANPKLCAEMDLLATNIMLACSFQDLTGQRTSKVVHALRYIEQRVNSMIQIWGVNASDVRPVADDNADARRDAHLLNGPARDGEGVSQDDIDKLLSGDAPEPAKAQSRDEPPSRPALAVKGQAAPAAFPEEDEPAGGASSQADIDALFS
jgi:chemotaxis regulatin CheY-phosphate phosphatase CheZ